MAVTMMTMAMAMITSVTTTMLFFDVHPTARPLLNIAQYLTAWQLTPDVHMLVNSATHF